MTRYGTYGALCICALFFIAFLSNCSSTKKIQSGGEFVPGEEYLQDTTAVQPADFPETDTVLPPGKNETDLYRVQMMAASTFQSAEAEKNRIRGYTLKDIFMVQEKSLWKIQIGDFSSREAAERELGTLRAAGWRDAWLVHFRKSSLQPQPQQPPAVMPDESAKTVFREYYTVQIIATTNKKEAENLKRNIELLNITDASLVEKDGFWKIHVGRFDSAGDARELLQRLREMGFHDSFLTVDSLPAGKKPAETKKTVELQQKTGDIYIEIAVKPSEQTAVIESRKVFLLTEKRANIVPVEAGWSVRLGPYASASDAQKDLDNLLKLGFKFAVVKK